MASEAPSDTSVAKPEAVAIKASSTEVKDSSAMQAVPTSATTATEPQVRKPPRPNSCLVAVLVLCILAAVAGFTYLAVFDSNKKFDSWWDRFFSSEREITKDGPLVLKDYDAGQWAYFIILCTVTLINLSIIIPALVVFLRRRCKRISRKVADASEMKDATVDAILPCYLPNEKDIIEETVTYILKHVDSPADFKLWLVYNTPDDMPEIEASLQALADRLDLPRGRKLAVIRAKSSKSKAENINLVLPQLTAKYAVIYDADHHPDPESLMLLIEKVKRKHLACAQGSTYIRNVNAGILARMIDAEFFVTHFVYFPCMRLLTRQAVFCGSNGLWQTHVLQKTHFDPKMQTEDIDVSVRMLLEKHNIDFCPEARSGELAPVSLQALFKQRQRWAIGWDQVSLNHFRDIFRSKASCTKKFAVGWVCYARWLMQVVGLIAGVGTPVLTFIQRQSVTLCHCGMGTRLLETCMFYFYLSLVISCTLEAILQIHHRGWQSLIQVLFVAIFMFAGCFYVVIQALLICISLFKISTGRVGGWVVTARGKQQPSASKGVAPVEVEAKVQAESEKVYEI